jgi:anti-sigma B factor antagonist
MRNGESALPDFEVTTSTENGVVTVAVDGELDIATAPMLDATLADVERGTTRTLLLDLDRVRFMDSTGLRSLLSALRRAEADGRRLRLANLPPDVERVLDVTGVRRIFDIASAA